MTISLEPEKPKKKKPIVKRVRSPQVVEVAFGATVGESEIEPLSKKQIEKRRAAERKGRKAILAKVENTQTKAGADAERTIASVERPTAAAEVTRKPLSLKQLVKKYQKQFAEEAGADREEIDSHSN